MKLSSKLLVMICLLSMNAVGQTIVTDLPDSYTGKCNESCNCSSGNQTPLGVMTDHVHPKGEWMVSYTYMNMMMKGNNIGDTKANDNIVYQKYMMAPETMSMQMHMLMLMYGLSNKVTLMLMQGYTISNMGMNMAANMPNMPGMTPEDTHMSSSSSGFTDTKVYGMYQLLETEKHRLIASIGVNLPTGTIRAKGTTMLGYNQRLPYDMQAGTGSFGIIPDVTYIRQHNKMAFGLNVGADIKLANNSLGYRQGNVYHATLWSSYKFLPFMSASVRAEEAHTDKISGSDPAIDIPIYVSADPTTNTANYGGEVLNLYAGLNFHFSKGVLQKFNLLAEYGMPLYQNLNGTQMANQSNLQLGLQYKL